MWAPWCLVNELVPERNRRSLSSQRIMLGFFKEEEGKEEKHEIIPAMPRGLHVSTRYSKRHDLLLAFGILISAHSRYIGKGLLSLNFEAGSCLRQPRRRE